ncbi:protein asteroid homolog 1 [Electrophorus electricus]|uniref:Asteroid domain-containing protein n=1 Tax=Electrophorus electricus TaxID=8005 RepID=A0A4W4DTE0_ELEEL|nr:protein asteroid homolog 1 [Electrophorus electricus]XP_026870776.2 protein asteroid homolog 1 [Electrophorus electricus]XP_026870777.2 protein asteroid homolog 1 [Electrophorus electricus]
MGVQGLTSYVEGNRQFFTDLKLRKSHLVIDGCSLYFRLYFSCGLDQARGGDYDIFAVQVRRFFAALSECGVLPFVVVDGGIDQSDRKFKTLRERAQSKIHEAHALSRGAHGSVLPLLTREVFRQVLRDLGVPLVQCVSEADFEVASLAHQWRCPVLSNDSDFYIFDLPGGYLPFTFFEWENVCGKTSERYIPALRFTVNRFCSHFNHMNKQLLPLFAVVTGNDYTPAETFEMLSSRVELQREARARGGRSNPRIEGLLLWLSQFRSPLNALEEVLGGRKKGNLRMQLMAGIQDYQLPPTSRLALLFSSSQAGLPDVQGLPVSLASQPEWLLRGITSGRLPPLVLDVLVLQRVLLIPQVENTRLPSSHEASLSIRKAIYEILLLSGARQDHAVQAQRGRGSGGKARASQSGRSQASSANSVVEEYDRLDLNLRRTSIEVHLTTTHPQLNLMTLDRMAASVRLQVLLGTLGVMEHVLQPLPPHLWLPACVTYFWVKSSTPRPSVSVQQCLLLGLVYGELCRRMALPGDPLHFCAATASVCKQLDRLRLNTGHRRGLDLGVAHSLSQWQSCMWAGIYLNQLLCFPLPEPHCVWLFSGTLLHGVQAALRGGHQAESLLAGVSVAGQLYAVLLGVVTGSVGQSQTLHSAPLPSAGRGRGRGRGRGQGKRRRGGGSRNSRERDGMQPVTGLENRFGVLTCEDDWN